MLLCRQHRVVTVVVVMDLLLVVLDLLLVVLVVPVVVSIMQFPSEEDNNSRRR